MPPKRAKIVKKKKSKKKIRRLGSRDIANLRKTRGINPGTIYFGASYVQYINDLLTSFNEKREQIEEFINTSNERYDELNSFIASFERNIGVKFNKLCASIQGLLEDVHGVITGGNDWNRVIRSLNGTLTAMNEFWNFIKKSITTARDMIMAGPVYIIVGLITFYINHYYARLLGRIQRYLMTHARYYIEKMKMYVERIFVWLRDMIRRFMSERHNEENQNNNDDNDDNDDNNGGNHDQGGNNNDFINQYRIYIRNTIYRVSSGLQPFVAEVFNKLNSIRGTNEPQQTRNTSRSLQNIPQNQIINDLAMLPGATRQRNRINAPDNNAVISENFRRNSRFPLNATVNYGNSNGNSRNDFILGAKINPLDLYPDDGQTRYTTSGLTDLVDHLTSETNRGDFEERSPYDSQTEKNYLSYLISRTDELHKQGVRKPFIDMLAKEYHEMLNNPLKRHSFFNFLGNGGIFRPNNPNLMSWFSAEREAYHNGFNNFISLSPMARENLFGNTSSVLFATAQNADINNPRFDSRFIQGALEYERNKVISYAPSSGITNTLNLNDDVATILIEDEKNIDGALVPYIDPKDASTALAIIGAPPAPIGMNVEFAQNLLAIPQDIQKNNPSMLMAPSGSMHATQNNDFVDNIHKPTMPRDFHNIQHNKGTNDQHQLELPNNSMYAVRNTTIANNTNTTANALAVNGTFDGTETTAANALDDIDLKKVDWNSYLAQPDDEIDELLDDMIHYREKGWLAKVINIAKRIPWSSIRSFYNLFKGIAEKSKMNPLRIMDEALNAVPSVIKIHESLFGEEKVVSEHIREIFVYGLLEARQRHLDIDFWDLVKLATTAFSVSERGNLYRYLLKKYPARDVDKIMRKMLYRN